MAGKCGQKINPYSVTMKNAKTEARFTTPGGFFEVELRSGYYNNALWAWIRSTVRTGSNYQWGSSVKLVTPCGSAAGLPYGKGNNWSVRARRCTAAICLGQPSSFTTVTFAGAAHGDHASKSARVI